MPQEKVTVLDEYGELDELDGYKKKRKRKTTKKRKTSAKKRKGGLIPSIVKHAHRLKRKFFKAYPSSKAGKMKVYGRMYKKLAAGRKAPKTNASLKKWALAGGEDDDGLGDYGEPATKTRKAPAKRKPAKKKLSGNTTMKKAPAKRRTKRKTNLSGGASPQLGRSTRKASTSRTKYKADIADPMQMAIESAVGTFLKPEKKYTQITLSNREVSGFLNLFWRLLFNRYATHYGRLEDEYEEYGMKYMEGKFLTALTGTAKKEDAIPYFASAKACEAMMDELYSVGSGKGLPAKMNNLLVICCNNLNLGATPSKSDANQMWADSLADAIWNHCKLDKVFDSLAKVQYSVKSAAAQAGQKVDFESPVESALIIPPKAGAVSAQVKGYSEFGETTWGNELSSDDDDEDLEFFGEDDDFDDDFDDDDEDFDLDGIYDDDEEFEVDDELQFMGATQPKLTNALGDTDLPDDMYDTDTFDVGDVEDDFSEDLDMEYGEVEDDFSEDLDMEYGDSEGEYYETEHF